MKAGKFRKRRRIQESLDRHDMTLADVARELGVSYQLVHRTVHGEINNRRVLNRFLALGVKPGDLDLPKDMRADDEAVREVA